MKFKYLVVDDEQLARKLIISHASKIELLELAAECVSGIEAINYIQKNKVDVIFLDIQMPELTGLDFIKTLKNPPAIILTTAHRDFAIDAFELDALDYILKPISFDRFLKAVNKFFQGRQSNQSEDNIVIAEDVIHIKADRKIYPILLKDILFIESLDDYVKVHLKDRILVTRENISTLEKKLPPSFVRIHRSFIIAKKNVESLSGESIWVGGKELPFGRAFKQAALNQLRK